MFACVIEVRMLCEMLVKCLFIRYKRDIYASLQVNKDNKFTKMLIFGSDFNIKSNFIIDNTKI